MSTAEAPAIAGWLPPGKAAGVCLTLDDVHPARSSDHYEAGGDLGGGVLGHLEWLFERHPDLRATLFVTPDWREHSPVPTRTRLARIPLARDRIYLTRPLKAGSMRLDRHPEFVSYLRQRPGFELAIHGLHHVGPGPRPPDEFARLGRAGCRRRLRRALEIFELAGLEPSPGFAPPAWNLSPALLGALTDVGIRWVTAARDLTSPIDGGMARLTGTREVSILHPQPLAGRVVHMTTNYQATSHAERAHDVIRRCGLLSIKAHAVKDALGHVALDGLDRRYRESLHRLFCELEDGYGDSIWWTTMGEVAERAGVAR